MPNLFQNFHTNHKNWYNFLENCVVCPCVIVSYSVIYIISYYCLSFLTYYLLGF